MQIIFKIGRRGGRQMSVLSLEDLRIHAENALAQVGEGVPLADLDHALIALGVAASVTSLDRDAIGERISLAYAGGASTRQIQEVISLISGLGVHSLMVSAAMVLAEAKPRDASYAGPLSSEQQALWDRFVGADPFWVGFERQTPGFLDAMLRLSTDQFVAFFEYCAVPWKSGAIRAVLKELIALASDATPTHRFLPGFRIHLANAIALGAGRAAIMQTLDIAAAAPLHVGVR